MSDLDPARVSKLLEMAAHPSSNEGEALNSLRALRAILARAGKSLSDLALHEPGSAPAITAPGHLELIERLRAEARQLRAENARLRRANDRIVVLQAELEAMRFAEPEAPEASAEEVAADRRPPRITDNLIAVYDLLSVWRSIPDITERLGAEVGASGVKKIVRLLDERGLLRCVEAWPTRYRLRPDGELGEAAKAFRSRIEDARLPE